MESGSCQWRINAPATVHIRPASSADHAAIEQLADRATQVLLGPFLTDEQRTQVSTFTPLDPWLLEDGTYYVMEFGGRIVASGGWSHRTPMIHDPVAIEHQPKNLKGTTARIRAMYTDPDFARMGLGRTILSVAEMAARLAGIQCLELIATKVGELLYKSCGYRRVETIELDMQNGVTIEVARMQKSIAFRNTR